MDNFFFTLSVLFGLGALAFLLNLIFMKALEWEIYNRFKF